MALLGSGFDPGVTNVFCAYAQKHLFDEIHVLDIIDCNAGDHGQPFATNSTPRSHPRGHGPGALLGARRMAGDRPAVLVHDLRLPRGHRPKKCFLMYHEELESLVRNLRGLRRARFWMTFSDNYLNHLKVLENVGMTRIDAVDYQGQQIVPLSSSRPCCPTPAPWAR